MEGDNVEYRFILQVFLTRRADPTELKEIFLKVSSWMLFSLNKPQIHQDWKCYFPENQ